MIVAFATINPACAETSFKELNQFIKNDTTDLNNYTQWYTCGHFARELAWNAEYNNMSLGSALLGNDRYFSGYDNHVLNYIIINDTYTFIDPQSDTYLSMTAVLFDYKYIRLYPDGTQVPSNWDTALRPHVIRNDTNFKPIFYL